MQEAEFGIVRFLVQYPLVTVAGLLLLGVLDYWLTVIGFRWHQRYRQPVVDYERYEQNPLWDRAIHQTRRYDWRYLLVVGGVGAVLGYLLISDRGAMAFETIFFVSLLLLTYARIIVGHLSSMRRARYIGSSPQEVQGKLRYSYRATLRLGVMGDQTEFLELLVLCALFPHPVTLAAAASPLLIASARSLWLRLYELRSGDRKPNPVRVIWECLSGLCNFIIVIGGAFWVASKLALIK